jgi:hypothetical protein
MQNCSNRKRPRDVNQFTKFIVDLCTGNPITEDISPIADNEKNRAAVELGRSGGLKGGKARASQTYPNNARK